MILHPISCSPLAKHISSITHTHQTYDSFEQVRHEIATQSQRADIPANETAQEPNLTSSALYKRSYSLATPQLLEVERPASRNSISSDTQVWHWGRKKKSER